MRRGIFTCVVTLACALLAGCDKYQQEKKDIRAAWDGYVKANERRDGEASASAMSKSTLDYYNQTLKLALDAPAQEVLKLPPSQMAEILRMRHRFKRAELKSINGRGYLVLACSRGWNTDDDPEWKLTAIRISGERAKAEAYDPAWEDEYRKRAFSRAVTPRRMRSLSDRMDEPVRYRVELVREGEAWKIDETAQYEEVDRDIRQAAKETRMSVRDFLVALEEINSESEQRIPMTIWDPKK